MKTGIMLRRTVTEYFSSVAELMLTTQVTDRTGSPISLDAGTDKGVQMLCDIRSASRKVMLIGNGGSAAIASHAQNDLSESAGVRAMVFVDQPLLTALANDHGYEHVYERPIQLWAESGDLLLTVSSSGKSENILRAIDAARDKGCNVITLSGFAPDNPSRRMGDLNFYVASDVYGYVESAHTALAHFLTTSLPPPSKSH